MSTSLPPALQNALLFPIKAQGAVTRLNPLGDPTIEQFYHQAMEQGRFLERNIADAQHWLLQKQQQLRNFILGHLRMNSLAVNGQLSNPARAVKYVADAITILNDVTTFTKEISALTAAVTQNIMILTQMEASMLQMVQANLNGLANLMNQICNWELPKLPSIPNLFPDTIWNWNGFNFAPLAAFEAQLAALAKLNGNIPGALSTLSTSFTFSQCLLNSNQSSYQSLFQNPPSSVSTYSGLSLGTPLFVPPLGGVIPAAGQSLTDPTFISLMEQNTETPVFLPPSSSAVGDAVPFNVNTSMVGAVPNPATIISNYQMPPATYQSNIVSIVPSLTSQTVEPTDSDYANPNLAVRDLSLRKALVQYVTLEQVVASNYDPNLTAAWLFYLELARVGRAGSWIPNLQVDYVTFVSPSLTYLSTTPTPWNCVLPSTQINNAPKAIPLIATLMAANATVQGNILWRLSYIEASLLGYTRAQDWDAYASTEFTASPTGTDLDYAATTLNSTVTTTVTLGETTAEYPTPCTFPSAMGNVLQQVIALAAINIQNTPTYTTSRPQFKVVYNQFAVATVVDRFTQFWREFNANLQALLLQDPYLVQFAVSYVDILDSAIDPLGNPAVYAQLQSDAATRNRSWTPGTPLLNIPIAPVVSYSTTAGPNAGQDGWQGTNFDPSTFLNRPDIQQLPIPTQVAMLRTNLSYADTQQSAQAVSSAIQNSIQQSQALLQGLQSIGFQVEVATAVDSVPVGNTGLQVSFDQIDLNMTGFVTSPNTFTIQTAGNYAVTVQLNWGSGAGGVRTVSAVLNGTTVLDTTSTDGTQTGPTTIQMAFTPYFNVGDVVTVVATHNLNTAQLVVVGSYISAILTDTTMPSSGVSVPSNTSTTQTFIADTAISSLTALSVSADGDVDPIDPTTVQTDGQGDPIYPIVSGVSLSSATKGGSLIVGTNYGGIYEYDGAGFTVGGLIYVGPGGVLTQDYSTIVNTCQWVIVIGRAISSNQFIYQPHIPNLTNLGSF